jgi:hypothetical protein
MLRFSSSCPTLACTIPVGLSPSDIVMSWLRLQTPVDCNPHPYYMYTQCFSTLICCGWAYECTLTLLRPGWAEVIHSVLVMLEKWFSLPCLETQTKESNISASTKVVNLCA